jgi:hypothetical protein
VLDAATGIPGIRLRNTKYEVRCES